MLYQIVSLLLEVVAGVLSGACLLRLYMQYQRIPMSARSGNPLGRFVFALTDWIVLPLRRVLPAIGALDTASLAAAFVLQLAEFGILWLLAGAAGGLAAVPILALFGLVRMAISGLTGAVIVYAILSWVQTNSVIADELERLVAPLRRTSAPSSGVAPLLQPIRRVLPLVGGVDLSPLALLVILQIAAIVLGSMQAAALLLV